MPAGTRTQGRLPVLGSSPAPTSAEDVPASAGIDPHAGSTSPVTPVRAVETAMLEDPGLPRPQLRGAADQPEQASSVPARDQRKAAFSNGSPQFDINPYHPSPVAATQLSTPSKPFQSLPAEQAASVNTSRSPATPALQQHPVLPLHVSSFNAYSLEESPAVSPLVRAAEAITRAALQPSDPVTGLSPQTSSGAVAAAAAAAAAETTEGKGSSAAGADSGTGDLYYSKEATIADVIERQKITSELVAETQRQLQMLLAKQQALQQMQQQLEQQQLLNALQHHQGFQQGRPVAALLAFRCLHHWGCFTDDRQSGLLERVGDALDVHVRRDLQAYGPAELQHIAYWLSTSCCLLWLLQRALGSSSAHDSTAAAAAAGVGKLRLGLRLVEKLRFGKGRQEPARQAAEIGIAADSLPVGSSSAFETESCSESFASWDEQAAQQQQQQQQQRHGSSPGSPYAGPGREGRVLISTSAALELQARVAQQLQQGLAQYKELVKKQLSLHTSSCVLEPAVSPTGELVRPLFSLDDDLEDEEQQGQGSPHAAFAGAAQASSDGAAQRLQPWLQLVRHLHEAIKMLRANSVPAAAIALVVEGLMSHLNVQLFNQLLLRPECCSFSNARYILDGLKELDKWFADLGPAHTGQGYQLLSHTRQAARLLLLEHKGRLGLTELLEDYCSAMSAQQVYRLCTTFCDDKGCTGIFPGDVLEALKEQHVLGNGGLIVTCLLDDVPGVHLADLAHQQQQVQQQGTSRPVRESKSSSSIGGIPVAGAAHAGAAAAGAQEPAGAAGAMLAQVSELVQRFEWRSSPLGPLEQPPSLRAGGCPDVVFAFLQQELVL